MASFLQNLSVAQQVARVKRKIAAISPAVRPAVQKQAEIEAAALVAQLKSYAPVDEGDLRDEIGWRPSKKGIGVVVISGNWKARWHEFGTEKMRATPYFFPPWRAKKKSIKARMAKAARDAGKKAVK